MSLYAVKLYSTFNTGHWSCDWSFTKMTNGNKRLQNSSILQNSFFPFDEVRSVTSFPSGGRDWSASLQQQRTISGFVFQKASLYSGELDTWEDSCSGVGRPYNQDVYYVSNDMVNSQNNGPFTFTASGAQCFGLNSGRKWIGYRSRRLTAIWFSFLRRII